MSIQETSVKSTLTRAASALRNEPIIRLARMIPVAERRPTHRNLIDPAPEVVREVHSAINTYLYEVLYG